MNTEDFINYSQAIALKKLGFDEYCDYVFTPEEHICPKMILSFDYREREGYVDSPTLWQAQKWLRREKRLSIEPWSCTTGEWACTIKELPEELDYLIEPGTKKWLDLDNFYNSYEEALSEGITECLRILGKGDENG